jgi:Uma2 family endonuclease
VDARIEATLGEPVMSTAKPGPRESTSATSRYVDPYDPMYPDSDGEPMAENMTQYRWMVTIQEGLDALYRDRDDVLVACDLLWYAVEGDPKACVAPDVLVAFGRPRGSRHSYKQWFEGHAPHVVFEIDSPSNTPKGMARKLAFYEEHGVEEYYRYDPETGRFQGWLRGDAGLEPIREVDGWTSPRLGVTFETPPRPEALILRGPDGEAFQHVQEVFQDRKAARRLAVLERRRRRRADLRAEVERGRAEAERGRAEAERGRAETERSRADAERRLREEADARAGRLAAKLRELGIEAD